MTITAAEWSDVWKMTEIAITLDCTKPDILVGTETSNDPAAEDQAILQNNLNNFAI